MKTCIYCDKPKSDDEFSLEHIIPQFLGGAYVPDYLKTRAVCERCNNNLGLFVDASFEKDFLVNAELKANAYSLFNPDAPSSLPLICMGATSLTPPELQNDEVCECWLGPLGETILLIRPSDERMYWYMGGNPRTMKTIRTRAYFSFSERSLKEPIISWLSFKDAFQGYKVKKIMCSQVSGANPNDIGFSDPDELDKKRIVYFTEHVTGREPLNNSISMYIDYDKRFMAKLALGLSHSFFGDQIRNTQHLAELRKLLWLREGEPEPTVGGVSDLSDKSFFLKENMGISNGVTITLLPTQKDIAINLNINRKKNWVITCAKAEDVRNQLTEDLLHGKSIVLFKTLKKSIILQLPNLIAHNSGNMIHRELDEIERRVNNNKGYFANL